PVGENGPLEAVSPSSERLGCEPVADSTLAIVVPAVVFRTVAAFLEAVVQIRPNIVLQCRNIGGKLEDAEAIVGLRVLADGEAVSVNVCAPYAFERALNLSEVGECPLRQFDIRMIEFGFDFGMVGVSSEDAHGVR